MTNTLYELWVRDRFAGEETRPHLTKTAVECIQPCCPLCAVWLPLPTAARQPTLQVFPLTCNCGWTGFAPFWRRIPVVFMADENGIRPVEEPPT